MVPAMWLAGNVVAKQELPADNVINARLDILVLAWRDAVLAIVT